MVIFTTQQWRIFNRIRRKYKVSLEFLNYNMPNILKFISYYARRLHFVLRRTAERSPRNQTVIIKYNRLMRVLFDESYRKRLKRRKRNVKQWSKNMVLYLRKTQGVKEYVITKKIKSLPQKTIKPEELVKQLREQLELLKSGKRDTQLMDCSLSENETKSGNSSMKIVKPLTEKVAKEVPSSGEQEQIGEFILNEKTGLLEKVESRPDSECFSSLNSELVVPETISTQENAKSSANILDLLMSKVVPSQSPVKSAGSVSNPLLNINEYDTEVESDEEFLGFAEDENIPGLMRTPLVPSTSRSNDDNAAFVSQSLDKYFLDNSLDRSAEDKESITLQSSRTLPRANIDGLMTLNCTPPAFDMPVVPESLQKLRTVAERRQFLQKFSKNFKLSIINNEAAIYRELQRKIRQPKTKIASQLSVQANGSQMSFTRQGWQAASFITTELNRFFYQKLFLRDEKQYVDLRGVRGNNIDQFKKPYTSRVTIQKGYTCTSSCIDCHILKCLKPLPTYVAKKKLCKQPYRAIFKACPLSKKPHQPLQEDDVSEILLSGGGLTVVRLPTVEIQVCPELGKPLNDVAKRYLEHIIPYENITREWAEFSTSTLQTQRSKLLPHNRKSFAFTVPYVNDRSHILVRRVVDRNERVDPYFLSNSEDARWSGLSFCANIDKKDEVQVECANVLADMINAVAISCSENSFIKKDYETQHILADNNTIVSKEKLKKRKISPGTQKTAPISKKSRLILELRRLNATIIETNAQHKDDIQCLKESCTLGCVCSSLNDGYPLQQHCGKPKCMLQCVCKASAPSQIIRIETDGRSITTEDAYNMRRQATARLARMEKEFTSTVVVTENETLLINETQYDKKRRCTKVPKRYQDYRDTDNEFGRISPVKSCSTPLNDADESRTSPATTISEIISDLPDPIYVKDAMLKQLKHCSIPIVPFKEIHNMAVWCMVHQLYKCFCGGHALDGKPMLIEKENSKTLTTDTEDNAKANYLSKAYYSFESTEEPIPPSTIKPKITEEIESVDKKITETKKQQVKDSNNKKLQQDRTPKTQIDSNFLKNYFADRLHLGCSRLIAVPSRTYRSINRRRREQILDDIEYIEDKKSQLLLNEHIMRSVYFHKEKEGNQIIKEELQENKETARQENATKKLSFSIDVDGGEIQTEEEKEDQKETPKEEQKEKEKGERKHEVKIVKEKPEIECTEKAETELKQKRSLIPSEESQPMPKKSKKNDTDIDDRIEDSKSAQIQNCYSLQVQNPCGDGNHGEQFPKATEAGLVSYPEEARENYNEVIKMLNSFVTRKMRDIDNALKRDSKIVPPPTENVLCVLQWRNFLSAFYDGLIFIWQVKMKTRTFLAATITNKVPMVLGALAVINITQTPLQQLPLIGRMILQGDYLDDSLNLAVIMQGRLHYWLMNGFLQPNAANVCLRPTPETHPILTKKINTLCSSLIKQRTREIERRDAIMKKRIKSNSTSTPSISESHNQPGEQQVQSKQAISVASTDQPCFRPVPQSNVVSTEGNKTLESTKFSQNNWVSNIKLVKLSSTELKGIQLPEDNNHDHSWYVLDLCNDFSHIFVPVQKEIVSLDRIQRLLALSVQKQKVISIQFLKRANFDAFIVPSSERKIYFGPFAIDAEPPLLVLLQSVDGKMMTREAYQSMHKIQLKSKQTTAFWLKQINRRICSAEEQVQKNQVEASTSKLGENSAAKGEEYDEDCFIVDNTGQSMESNKHILSPKILHAMPQKKATAVQIVTSKTTANAGGFVELSLPAAMQNDKSESSTKDRTTIFIQGQDGKEQKVVPPVNDTVSSKKSDEHFSSQQKKGNKRELSLPATTQNDKSDKSSEKDRTTLIIQDHDGNKLEIVPLGNDNAPNKKSNNNFSSQQKETHKRDNEMSKIQPAHTLKSLLEQKPFHITQPVFLNKISQMGPTKVSQNILQITPKKLIQLPKTSISTVDQKATFEKPNRSVVITNRPSVGVSNANTNCSTSTIVAGKMLKNTVNTTQRIAIKSLNSSLPTDTLISGVASVQQQTHNIEIASSKQNIETSLISPAKTPADNAKVFTTNSDASRSSTSLNSVSSATQQMCNKESIACSSKYKIGLVLPKATALSTATSSTPPSAAGDLSLKNTSTQTAVKRSTTGSFISKTHNSTFPSVDSIKKVSADISNFVRNRKTQYKFFNGKLKPIVPKTSSSEEKTATSTSVANVTQQNINQQSTPIINNGTNSLQSKCMQFTIHNDSIPTCSSTTISSNPVPPSLSYQNQYREYTAIKGKTKLNDVQALPVYGYFVPNLTGVPRFFSKRTQSVFLIKVPGFGLIKADGIVKANAFLNQYIAKVIPPTKQKILWTFEPQKNKINIQNKVANVPKASPNQLREVTEKEGKIITPPNVNLKTIPGFKQTLTGKPSQQQRTQSVFMSKPTITGGETILIDD